MAGMRVVVVKANAEGSIDLEDLRDKCSQHADALAAIMVTYPSTHGVYEDTITDCANSCTRTEARCMSTGPTSMRFSATPSRGSSVGMSLT